jgi:hypothetical protein
MGDEIKKLLSKVKSLLILSLIQFCARNPSINDTARGYSKRLGWDERKVTESLEELVSLNLLKKREIGDDVFYMVREEWIDVLRDWIRSEDASSRFFIAKAIFESYTEEDD